jgi:hypothetical protein
MLLRFEVKAGTVADLCERGSINAMPKVDLKTAWIVFDGGNLTDILTARKTFDDVVEYAKELYLSTRMNFAEKALLAHYNSGSTVRDAVFANLPVETHYTSALYKQLMESEADIDRIGGLAHERLAKQFANGPQYVIVGVEPTIEIRRVTELHVETSDDGSEIVSWEELSNDDGGMRRERFVAPPHVENR